MTATELWRAGTVDNGYTAIARVIDDPTSVGPQVIAVDEDTLEILDGADGRTLFGPITYETLAGLQLAGPPTIADFDADGRPEIGVAGERRYIVFDPDLPTPHIAWSEPSMDSSTGTVGSTVFDFDADGSAEVLYNDECHLRILSGRDGSLLWFVDNTSLTASEYPVVADVDGDGNAELISVANMHTAPCESRALPFSTMRRGVRVYRDRLDNWVPSRPIWNQHTYHLDNVDDDGAIPTVEARSWESHNTYRLNALLEPEAVTKAPDLVVVAHSADPRGCPATAIVRARVQNRGSRGVPGRSPRRVLQRQHAPRRHPHRDDLVVGRRRLGRAHGERSRARSGRQRGVLRRRRRRRNRQRGALRVRRDEQRRSPRGVRLQHSVLMGGNPR